MNARRNVGLSSDIETPNVWFGLGHKRFKLSCRKRLGKEVALRYITSLSNQYVQCIFALDTLSHDSQLEIASQCNYGLHNDSVCRVIGKVTNKGLVDFQLIDR
jgi:hypothetical protein